MTAALACSCKPLAVFAVAAADGAWPLGSLPGFALPASTDVTGIDNDFPFAAIEVFRLISGAAAASAYAAFAAGSVSRCALAPFFCVVFLLR